MDKSHWRNRYEYLLSIIGFVIGLGNFWLFPTTCYKHGGAVFLIPYAFFVIVIGIPIVYLELLLGQVFRRANVGIYEEICPWLKGAAISVIIMNIIRQTYYNTVISWALQLFFASFTSPLPWASDTDILNSSLTNDRLFFESFTSPLPWTSDTDIVNSSLTNDRLFSESFTSPLPWTSNTDIVNSSLTNDNFSRFYFIDTVLGKSNSTGINDLKGLQSSLLPCLMLVFIVAYIAVYDGATSIGSIVYVTAILPYVMLLVLLIKSATLQGAGDGIKKLFAPKLYKLKSFYTWQRAAIQICYSLGPGSGVLVAYASYADNREMNIKRYAILVVVCNAITSILCGIVLFCGLGHFSAVTGVEFDSFLDLGYTVIFVIYPMIISKFAYGFLFSIAFFSMIFMIGLNSVYAELEGMYAALADRFHSLNVNMAKKKLIIIILCFLASLPTVTKGGSYVVTFLLTYGIAPAVLLILAIEAVAASWIYGFDRLVLAVRQYSNVNNPGKAMKYAWRFSVPLFSVALYISNFLPSGVDPDLNAYGPANVTVKTRVAGEVFNGLTLLPIPVYGLFWLFRSLYRKNSSTEAKKIVEARRDHLNEV